MKKLPVILLLLCLLPVSGCIEHRDIDQLNMVLGATFDYNPQDQRYEVHAQIAKASAFAKGMDGKGEETFLFFDGTGSTIFEAIRDMSKNSNLRLFWSHCDVYVVGEELARRGVFPLLDFMMRDNEIRETAYFFVSHTPVKELVTLPHAGVQTPLQTAKGKTRVGIESHSTTTKKRLTEIYRGLLRDNSFYVVPVISIRQPMEKSKESSPKYQMSGAAVFKEDKMIGHLTPIETRGYTVIANQIKDAVIPVNVQGNQMTLELTTSKCKVKPHIIGDRIYFTVEATPKFNYGEVDKPTDLADPFFANKVEQAFNEALRKEILNSVTRAKAMKADYFDFARQVQLADPELWKRIKDDWSEKIFPQVDVKVVVKSKLLRTGMLISTGMGGGK